jgi:hypothetical protein
VRRLTSKPISFRATAGRSKPNIQALRQRCYLWGWEALLYTKRAIDERLRVSQRMDTHYHEVQRRTNNALQGAALSIQFCPRSFHRNILHQQANLVYGRYSLPTILSIGVRWYQLKTKQKISLNIRDSFGVDFRLLC